MDSASFLAVCNWQIRPTPADNPDLFRSPVQNKEETCESCASTLLTEATELTYDIGQGDVGHTLQLVLDVLRQHRVAQVPGLNGALHQGHPSAMTPLPAIRREENNMIKMEILSRSFNHTNNTLWDASSSLKEWSCAVKWIPVVSVVWLAGLRGNNLSLKCW